MKLAVFIGAISGMGVLCWLAVGSPLFRPRHIETLNTPSVVVSWTEDGLNLADGPLLPLPGIRKLPLKSEALVRATGQGVEVDGHGRVIGLVSLWHWCGNDPMKEDVRRVDIADMMIFLGQVEPEAPPASVELTHPGSGSFSDSGWNISEYLRFQTWKDEVEWNANRR